MSIGRNPIQITSQKLKGHHFAGGPSRDSLRRLCSPQWTIFATFFRRQRRSSQFSSNSCGRSSLGHKAQSFKRVLTQQNSGQSSQLVLTNDDRNAQFLAAIEVSRSRRGVGWPLLVRCGLNQSPPLGLLLLLPGIVFRQPS